MVYFYITSFIVLISSFLYLFLSNKNKYWKKRGVRHPAPKLLLGNYADYILLRRSLGHVVNDISEEFSKETIIGAYYGTEPAIIIKDPELIKLVMTKDFYYFNTRELKGHEKREVATQNLFHESGDKWKVVRQNLSPVFTSGKMKLMFPLIQNCTKVFGKLLEEEISANTVSEVRTLMARFTIDCIGSCAFGIDTKAMGKEDKNNPFRTIATDLFDSSDWRAVKNVVRSIWPNIFYGLGLNAFTKDTVEFFHNLITTVFKERNNTPTSRNDFVDYILGLKLKNRIYGDELSRKTDNEEKKKVCLEVDDDLLVAQCVIFFAAGFETSATTLSFTIYELAKDKESQKRAIAEVDAYLEKREGQINYDCVTELPFLEACADEALRLYPVLGCSTREVVEPYTLPNGLQLDKGVRVHIPVLYLHRNPEYFTEPETYKPERFLPENKENIIPYSYIPFGEGPKICIGMRFAKMQMLAGLVTLLRNYTVELAPGMPSNLEYNPKSFVTQANSGIYLRFTARF